MQNNHSIHPLTVKALHWLSKLLELRSPFRTKNVSYFPETIVFFCYQNELISVNAILFCFLSQHRVLTVFMKYLVIIYQKSLTHLLEIYSDSLSYYSLCTFFEISLFFINWGKLAPISWLWAYDLELLFGDLTGPCRGPSLRNESSLELFIRERTSFQLERQF